MSVLHSWTKFLTSTLPVVDRSQIQLRGGSGFGYRFARKVYEPGEEVPTHGKKLRAQMDTGSEPVDSSTTFNATIGNLKGSKAKKMALEGVRLIEDAILAGLKLEKLFVLKTMNELPPKIKSLMTTDVKVENIGQKQLQAWSSLTTPPGIIGIFPKPTGSPISQFTSHPFKLPVTVVCDNLREPGNLGSILRSAAGAGCKKVLLSKGSVDPWDGKVLRGGSGAHFRLPIISDIPMFTIGTHLDLPAAITAAASSPSPAIGIFVADSNFQTKSEIPTVSYEDINYQKYHEIYLVLGSEGGGIGDDTFQIISSLKSSFDETHRHSDGGFSVDLTRIRISLDNQVESLNVANAFGIIVFEIKRQLRFSSNSGN